MLQNHRQAGKMNVVHFLEWSENSKSLRVTSFLFSPQALVGVYSIIEYY